MTVAEISAARLPLPEGSSCASSDHVSAGMKAVRDASMQNAKCCVASQALFQMGASKSPALVMPTQDIRHLYTQQKGAKRQPCQLWLDAPCHVACERLRERPLIYLIISSY